MADIITVMNLGWRYAAPGGGGEPIQGLRDASCYVQQGALAGVIGPTGSGKSTLVKALAGIIPHCTNGSLNGYVRIADMNVKSTTVSDLSLRVGYVGQDPRAQLTSPTVAEEIAFPLVSVMVTMVLLKVERICATPFSTFLRSRRFLTTFFTAAMSYLSFTSSY